MFYEDYCYIFLLVMHINKNIKFLRKSKNLSQTQLGNSIGVTHVQIGAYEKGDSFPRFEGLLKLSELFGVGLDDLVFRDLSQEAPRELQAAPEETYEQRTQKLLDLLEAELNRYRQAIRQKDPDLARQLGIGEE